VVKQEAKGFGARLWGKGQVRDCLQLFALLKSALHWQPGLRV
jgi:hypothetical protein